MPGSLKLDVFNTGYRPVPSAIPVWPSGWEATWPATTASLISGDRDAILVDSLVTKRESQELADWLTATGKNLTQIYITHGHADHFFGLNTVLETHPEAKAVALAGLVYIAAFGLDEGESLGALLSQGPVTPALAHLFTDKQGFGWLSEDDFVNHFAADVDPAKARVMFAVQQALAGSAFTDVMGVPAWKSLPSWYLVAADDQAIPPAAERQFAARMGATTIEVPSSHVAMVSHPDDVAQLIETAAETVPTAN